MNQLNVEKKKYRVHVTETITNYGIIEVEAYSQFEAEMVAEDEFQSSEHDDGTVGWDTCLLSENGVPVVWSDEAAAKGSDSPYVPFLKTQASPLRSITVQSE